MTKEEYKENLIRMWDSLRDRYKGENCCAGVTCTDCPCHNGICDNGSIMSNAYEAIDLVENWAKEHPIKTNSQKFEEVFGFKPFTNNCINGEVKCDKCECYDYGVCDAHNRFWNAEYNEKTKEGGE